MTGATDPPDAAETGSPGVVCSTTGLGMRVGVRYVVTRGSVDREFQRGDRIRLCADGAIENIDAQGWMAAEDVHAATREMAFEVDAAWIESQRETLAAQMAALHA